MKVPYIKIEQKNETFYVTKIKASVLRDHVNFHFRDPYSSENDRKVMYSEYINKIMKKGIDISPDEEGIQRRLQYDRINKIKKYLEDDQNAYFPTSVVLAVDISQDDTLLLNYEQIENNECGILEFSDDIMFQIVDGQHRLAGLFISKQQVIDEFDISAVLLLNATKSTCAKVFADINGNQAKVNKSVIYDLYEEIDVDDPNDILKQKLHYVCDQLNSSEKSPLFRHIKMLGIGQGAVSQAFLIQYLYEAIKDMGIGEKSSQYIYEMLYIYFRCFQRAFPNEWPVLEKDHYKSLEEFQIHSNYVLKTKKSQMLKTNGIGAIILVLPKIYSMVDWSENRPSKDIYSDCYAIVSKLIGCIDWVNDSDITQGTGKKIIGIMKMKLLEIITK